MSERLEESSAMLGEQRLQDLRAQAGEACRRRGLIDAHLTREAHHIGCRIAASLRAMLPPDTASPFCSLSAHYGASTAFCGKGLVREPG